MAPQRRLRELRLLRLRDVLGLRSAVNTVLRVLNPAGAETAVQGVYLCQIHMETEWCQMKNMLLSKRMLS